MEDGKSTRLPALPLQMDGKRFGLRHDLPKHGQHTKEILEQAGMSDKEIEEFFKTGVVA
jgi:crotonobetainyl-CoA:carnitine CoA-transferase CaiB-like acyl-CoA transferase